ncbi:hypothetical protein NQZ68_020685 [Dissostichus eleginoides]|nr:hypothetical protein NQZ68_020685 [Dissostichus eleginoides]
MPPISLFPNEPNNGCGCSLMRTDIVEQFPGDICGKSLDPSTAPPCAVSMATGEVRQAGPALHPALGIRISQRFSDVRKVGSSNSLLANAALLPFGEVWALRGKRGGAAGSHGNTVGTHLSHGINRAGFHSPKTVTNPTSVVSRNRCHRLMIIGVASEVVICFSLELFMRTDKSQVMSKVKTDKISVPQSIPAIHKSKLTSPKSRREIPKFGSETDKSQVKTGKSLIKADKSQVKTYKSQVKTTNSLVKNDKSQVKNNKFKVKNHTFQVKFDQSNVRREKQAAASSVRGSTWFCSGSGAGRAEGPPAQARVQDGQDGQ